MKRFVLLVVCAFTISGSGSSVFAQSTPAPGVGVRGLATFGVSQMTASDSFDAVLGSSSLNEIGGGGQVTNLWRGLFAEVAVGRSKETGDRVFVDGGTVYQLGIPLTMTLTTIDATAGYRFNRGGRLVPYVGAGYTSAAYEETSPFAQAGDDVDARFDGVVAMAGMEVRTFRWLHVRGEARYRQVPDALGSGGVSAAFGDDSLGGLRFGFTLAVGR